jgi:lipoprotein-anchoring transpeptidase ErfK/SrfK
VALTITLSGPRCDSSTLVAAGGQPVAARSSRQRREAGAQGRARPGRQEGRLLAKRPNGSTGWVKDSAVDLVLDPYSISVSLHSHRIVVRNGNLVFLSAPAGVGRSVLPTPTGRYYIVELLKQSDPSGPYGPYAFGLSAFSNFRYSFGGGPGEIGLYGTDEPQFLGTDVSHGCIRVSNVVNTRLAGVLPLGMPVVIEP